MKKLSLITVLLLAALLAVPAMAIAEPSINPTSQDFYKNTGANVAFEVQGMWDVKTVTLDELQLTPDADWSWVPNSDGSGGTLILFGHSNTLNNLPSRDYVMKAFDENKNYVTATLRIKDQAPAEVSISPKTATFDLAAPKALDFTLKGVPNVEKIDVFGNDGAKIVTWGTGSFTYSSGTLTITQNALMTLAYQLDLKNPVTCTMKVNGQDSLAVAITFKDEAAAASITPKTEEFNLADPKALTFKLTGVNDVTKLVFAMGEEGYEEWNKGGGLFTYADGKLTLTKEALTNSAKELNLENPLTCKMKVNGDANIAADITFKNVEVSIDPKTAEFSLADPKALTFTLKGVNDVTKLVFVTGKSTYDEWTKESGTFTYADGKLTLTKDALTLYAETLDLTNPVTYKMKVNGDANIAADVTFKKTGSSSSSSSSGGCNAGATAAMLMLCAVPMFFRRKK